MAWLFKQKRSPFWWVGYRDPATGRVKREPTGFRIGIGEDYGKARARRAKLAEQEAKACRIGQDDRWDSWVLPYLSIRYANADRTYERVQHNWRFLSLYLEEHEVVGPQQLT